MANTLLTPSIIAKEAALQVVNNLVFARLANKQFREDFTVKIGDTVSYRKPIRFTPSAGATLVVQDVTENSDTIIINKRFHVAWQFYSRDLTLTVDQYAERYLRPAALTLAQQIDQDGALLYKDVFNAVGTAAVAPTFATVLNARQRMNEFAVPMNDRFIAINPAGSNSIMSNLTTFLQPSLIEDITKEGSVGRLGAMDMFESQNVQSHTKGTGATIVVSTNAASGDAFITLTAASGTLKPGDVITFATAGVPNAVNPISKADLGYAQQFTVTGTTTFTLSGTPSVVPISPSIISSGAYQTVTALPTTSSTVVVLGSHTANLAWQRNAFSLVTVPVVAPEGAVWAETVEYQGLGLRFLRAFDVTNDVEIARLDVMYGWKTTYPELACRILG